MEDGSFKNGISQYRKTIVNTVFSAFCSGITFSALIFFHKIAGIRAGEYPEQPVALINEQLHAAMPGLVAWAVFRCLLFTAVLFVLILLSRFKILHDINLIREWRDYRKRKKMAKEESE